MRDPLVIGVSQPYSPPATNRGYSGMLQQWYETNFDATSGYTNRVEYKGLDWSAAQTLANYFTSYGISANLKNEHGVSTLTITDATGNYVIDKWELSVDREQPDVFENQIFLALMNNAAQPTAAISMLRTQLKNDSSDDTTTDAGWYSLVATKTANPTYDATSGTITGYGTANTNQQAQKFLGLLGPAFYGSYPGNNGTTGATNDWTSANMVKLKQYYDAYNLGVTNFLRGKYRLRHTSNIPALWNVSVADFNVEKIYTISQLIAECTGGGFIYPLPRSHAGKSKNFLRFPPS